MLCLSHERNKAKAFLGIERIDITTTVSYTFHKRLVTILSGSGFSLAFQHTKQAVCKTNLIFLCRKIGAGLFGLFSVVFLAVFLPVYFLVIKKSDPSSGGPYKREAVATDTQQCSEIGKDILNANGSTVDAATVAMFCQNQACIRQG